MILRAATFLVLRYGSQLRRVSLFKFFTFCWLRISHSSRQRWASLRRRTSSFGGESPMAPAAQAINPTAQPLLQSDPGHA